MGNIRLGITLMGAMLLSVLSSAQLPFGQQNNSSSPDSTSTTNQTQPYTNTGGGTLPNCSLAQPGQACIKDNATEGGATGSSSGASTGPVINSTPDEMDGPILPSGSSSMQSPGQSSTSGTSRTNIENPSNENNPPANSVQRTENQQYTFAPQPLTQFQRFVTTSTGNRLPIFGHSLFENVPSTFAPFDQAPVTGGYAIGPGDQLVVRAWGQVDINYKATVDRNGAIYLPHVGSIQVAGVHYADLTDYVRSQIGRIYHNFDLTVTLGRLRSIPVYVVGEARRPGNYTISSLSTLVNAVFASGGPSNSGSMRHIQLKRNDQIVTDFDLYDLLLRGDKSKDVQLLPGDVIYIPPVGQLVAVSGSINNPAIYELRGETSLEQLLSLTGGLSNTADGQRVIVERIDNHTVRHMEQFNLDATGLARPVKDGDVVTVFPLNPRFDNAVILRGNVAVPGRFPWHEGMRVSDLIPSRNSLMTPDYWLRLNSSASTATPARTSAPTANSGAAAPNTTRAMTSGQEQLRNQIQRTAPEINWEYAVIQRLHPETLTSTLIPFNLGKAVDGDPQADLQLSPGDVITIFSQADIRVPIQQQSKYVHLEGEVAPAGVYKAESGETLRHLLARIGGLSPNAYLYGARMTRESTRIEQQAQMDQLVENYTQDVEREASAKSQNLTNPAEAVVLPAVVESERRLAERLRAVRATGRIVLNLKPDATTINSLPDIRLEDGDRLYVPYRPSTVSVLGAVYNQADFIYNPDRKVADYLRQAGGPTRTGDKKRIYIVRANGSVRGMEGSSLFTGGIMGDVLYPGDTLVVPEQISKTTFKKYLLDYSQILSQFGLGAAAIKVLSP